MKKSMSSAYTDMMTNLAKSTVAVPLHLQKATEALAWWESPDSLLAKSSVGDDDLQKASAEHETDEAYEEDHDRAEQAAEDSRELPNSATDIHGGHEADEQDVPGGSDEAEEEKSDDVKKSLAALSAVADQLLAKSRAEA